MPDFLGSRVELTMSDPSMGCQRVARMGNVRNEGVSGGGIFPGVASGQAVMANSFGCAGRGRRAPSRSRTIPCRRVPPYGRRRSHPSDSPPTLPLQLAVRTRSSGTLHKPSAFAIAIAHNPGSRIRPSAMMRSIRAVLTFDQTLVGFRGENYCLYLRSSIGLALQSNQLKPSASSTASSPVMLL